MVDADTYGPLTNKFEVNMKSRTFSFKVAIMTLLVMAGTSVTNAQVFPQELDRAPTLDQCAPQSPSVGSLECQVMEALSKIQGVQVGSTREDLVKLFVLGGGISTNNSATYWYRECTYIQVDVEFSSLKPGERSLSDTITKISRPYVAVPFAG